MITKIGGIVISSGFGATEGFRSHPHTGVDIPMDSNSILQTFSDGVVTKVFDGSTDIGNGIAIKTKDGITHIYGHLNQTTVEVGDKLHVGDIIGLSGNTGKSTGPHLHFATQNSDGSFTDPTALVDKLAFVSPEKGFMGKIGDWFARRGEVDQYQYAEQGGDHPFWDWVGGHVSDGLTYLWDQFIFYLPDIIGYTTVGAGTFIILGSMIGRGGMLKPLAFWSGIVIAAICILMGGS
jgi:Peptidase family M23